ncbi:endonuclease/exonuclease/phosphatase family protein [Georgenia sp. TF02-10]|uniref:endonuclease/exonuclease/phosphatase family protein n=1 Tax=Georgenia sp. TF02-10 TaxID=2917725 RepID=UPI001FA80FCA|nr:endonuclease/exonuclease/phosphatase family protein [Georgenia sp. TF02-10]UNX55051.1 endonuclease/exonuclease/phosphatase family protein [Georgenia sp. TF02-10]
MRVIGWLVVLLLAVAAVLTLNPEWLGRVNPDWAGLTTTAVLAPVYGVRPLLAVLFAVVAVIALILGLVRRVGFGGGGRTLFLGLVLAAVAVGHGWMVWDRGPDNPPALTADDGLSPAGPGSGALTVLAWNTQGGRTGAADVAAVAEENGADVLVLSETDDALAGEVVGALAGSGATFQTFFADAGDRGHVALLVSNALGEYVPTEAPATSAGAVRAEPANGVGPVLVGVHTARPVGEDHDAWLADLDAVLPLCTDGGADRLVLAGDLNATLDHAPLQDLGACRDGAVGAGVGGVATWPTQAPELLGATIDHVLHDADAFRATEAVVVERGRSDHRAVVVRLVPAG